MYSYEILVYVYTLYGLYLKYNYLSHPKSSRIDQTFVLPGFSSNQNLMEICFPPFSAVMIQNPKVGTVQKIRGAFVQQIDPRTVVKNCVCFGPCLKTQTKFF